MLCACKLFVICFAVGEVVLNVSVLWLECVLLEIPCIYFQSMCVLYL